MDVDSWRPGFGHGAFRRLLRDLPQPMMHLAFTHRSLEHLGPMDPSVDRTRQLTTDNMLRAIGDVFRDS